LITHFSGANDALSFRDKERQFLNLLSGRSVGPAPTSTGTGLLTIDIDSDNIDPTKIDEINKLVPKDTAFQNMIVGHMTAVEICIEIITGNYLIIYGIR